jgi:hypothetical protein
VELLGGDGVCCRSSSESYEVASTRPCTLARLPDLSTPAPRTVTLMQGDWRLAGHTNKAVAQGRDQARSMRHSVCGLYRIIVFSVAFLDIHFIVSSNTPLHGVGDNSEHG